MRYQCILLHQLSLQGEGLTLGLRTWHTPSLPHLSLRFQSTSLPHDLNLQGQGFTWVLSPSLHMPSLPHVSLGLNHTSLPHNSIPQGQGFTWVRNLFTEQPVVTDGKSCNAAQPCAAQPRTICPFVK